VRVDHAVDGQRRQQRRDQNYCGEAGGGVVTGDQPVRVDPGEPAAEGIPDRDVGQRDGQREAEQDGDQQDHPASERSAVGQHGRQRTQ